jgi:hypothetical protein
MQENLINANLQYLHPATKEFTRMPLAIEEDGEIKYGRPPEVKLRTTLFPEDVVRYYYEQVGINSMINLKRDIGAIQYLIKGVGLDLTLFAIDAMVTEYYESEDRGAIPPMILKANGYLNEASIRMAEVRAIGRQHGIIPQDDTKAIDIIGALNEQGS